MKYRAFINPIFNDIHIVKEDSSFREDHFWIGGDFSDNFYTSPKLDFRDPYIFFNFKNYVNTFGCVMTQRTFDFLRKYDIIDKDFMEQFKMLMELQK